MPIDREKALAAKLDPFTYEYTERDVMLYALAVGAGVPQTEEEQLKFCYEKDLKALPTFGVIPTYAASRERRQVPGFDFNPMMLLHGEQYLEIRKHPIPTSGKLTNQQKISGIYDKGKGALVIRDTLTTDGNGEEVFFNSSALFIRGEGGFGGERGPKPGNIQPEREPDKIVEEKTLPQQALIYRLCGDYNPLHVDPAMAATGGFDVPILHGLCTFGIAGRAVLREYCDNDPAKFKSIQVRFSSHVFPGETIATEMWKESDEKILLKARSVDRGLDVLTNAAVTLNR